MENFNDDFHDFVALSDDELSNDKFLIPAKSLTAFTSFFCRLGVGIVKFLFGGQRETRISTQSGFNLLTPMSKVRVYFLIIRLSGKNTGHDNVDASNKKDEHEREGLNSSSEEIFVWVLDKAEDAGVDDSYQNLK